MTAAQPSLARLRTLLAGDGILHSTPAQPVMHRDGAVAPWMLYSWNVTLTGEGLSLAAACLLARLASSFRSTQLAAHGMTGLPLLSACVALGGGRYTGVAVRKERKPYLSRRLVEGPLDRSRSVVIVDDSLSSGTALHAAISALEAEGCTVEGAVVLVNFPNRGGMDWATANGYRVDALFDIATDLGQPLFPAYQAPPPLPPAQEGALAAGLVPAVLARRVAEHVLVTGTRPVPPPTLDRSYDGRGGVFVSLRRRSDDHRLARSGLWHFDDEPADAAADVVDATIATLRDLGGTLRLADLAALKISVTFLGPMEPISPRQLDFDRYAIVVRDVAGQRAGGALPNTQVFTSEVEQYTHAWQRNARITATEPHRLYRQVIDKSTEPGTSWPAYGAPDPPELAWCNDPATGTALAAWARALLTGADGAGALRPPDHLIASPIEGVAVTLYRGRTLGAAVAWGPGPVADRLAEAVNQLRRRTDPAQLAGEHLAVMVGVLHEAERLGGDAGLAAKKVRRGLDTLRFEDPSGSATTLLPGALVYNGWSKEQLVSAVCGGMPGRPGRFTTYRTPLWLDDGQACRRICSGFPVREPDEEMDPARAVRSLAGFTRRNLGPGGVPLYRLDIVSGRRTWQGTGPRQLHALMGLDRAGGLLAEPALQEAARVGLAGYLSAASGAFSVGQGGPLADAIVVAAVGRPGHPLACHPGLDGPRRRLASWLDPFGRIAAAPVRLGRAQDFEYLPGAVLTALATDPDLLAALVPGALQRCLDWHRHRFEVLHTWGQVGWQTQGWAAIWHHQHRDEQADFIFELADWALERQLDKNGAFLEDLSPSEPSFNTGFLAEGIAAAWSVARAAGDSDRAHRYEASWRAAGRFMHRLLVTPADTFCSADPQAALGGVRLTASVPHVRADSVSHWLNALVSGLALLGPDPQACGA